MGLGVDIDPLGCASDAILVERCRMRERGAERELFRSQFHRVHATLFRILGKNRESEDLAQETFIEVFRSLHRFRGEARLGVWIDRIAVRVAFRHIASRQPLTVQLELCPEPADERAPPDRRAHAREGLRRLYQALGRLRPAARLAFTLHVIDGRPVGEVAHITSSSAVATKVRIWRARRELERIAAEDPVLAAYLAAGGRKET